MKYLKMVLSLGLCTGFFFMIELTAVIKEAPTVEALEDFMKDCDAETFVLFDVDQTLIIPADVALQASQADGSVWNKYSALTIRNPSINVKKYSQSYLLNHIFTNMQFKVVEPSIVELIRSLQEKQIKTIAFTRLQIGSEGNIRSIEDWRIKHLNKHAIDFSQAFSPLFDGKIQVPNFSRVTAFKQGVLFSNLQDKGPALIAFLKHIRWEPKKIIFVDDRLDYIQCVEQSLAEVGIDFVGLHYTYLEKNPAIIDEQLTEFQFTHLARTGIWLNDQEAKELMQSR